MAHLLVMIGVTVLAPALCFGLLFWLAWLEDTLADDLTRAGRRRVPEPILAIAIPESRQGLELVQTFTETQEAGVLPVSATQIQASPDVAAKTATA